MLVAEALVPRDSASDRRVDGTSIVLPLCRDGNCWIAKKGSVETVVVVHRESRMQLSLWTCPSVSPTAPTAQDTGEDLRTLWIGCGCDTFERRYKQVHNTRRRSHRFDGLVSSSPKIGRVTAESSLEPCTGSNVCGPNPPRRTVGHLARASKCSRPHRRRRLFRFPTTSIDLYFQLTRCRATRRRVSGSGSWQRLWRTCGKASETFCLRAGGGGRAGCRRTATGVAVPGQKGARIPSFLVVRA